MAFQIVRLFPLTQGIHLGYPPHRLPPGFSPRQNNVRTRDQILRKRPGTKDFNGSGALAGDIVSMFEYRRETGAIEVLAVTGGATLATRRIYRSSAGAWNDITDAQLTDGDGPVDPDMVGTNLEPYDATVAPSASQVDVLYFSNGNNAAVGTNPEILKWDGIAGTATAMTTGPGSCRTLTTYANRLILGYIYDGTQYRGNRVVWSKEGDAENYADPSSGTIDLVETSDLITKLATLRGRLVCYKQNSIVIGLETGLSTIPIRFSYISKSIGAIAGFSVAQANDEHFFLGQDNVYAFDGASIRSIGDPIKRDLRLVNASNLRQVFAVIDPFNSEYWLFVPEGSETFPTHAWVYNYQENHWSRWSFPQSVLCGTRGTTSTALTWATITGTWDSIAGTWDDYSITGAPTLLLGMGNKTADEISFSVLNDGSSPIDATWESRDEDFVDQPGVDNQPLRSTDLKTLSRVAVRYQGAGGSVNLNCEVSTDGGTNFQSFNPVPGVASPSGGVISFHGWLTGTKFRVRLGNRTSGQNMPNLEEIELHYLPRGNQI